MIDYTDIDKAEEGDDLPALSHIGVVFFDPTGAWHAECPGREYSRSSIGPINQLDPGLWLTDLSFEEVRGIAQGLRRVLLKSDGWIRMTMPQLLSAWGFSGLSRDASVKVGARIIDRIYRMTQEVILRECRRSRQDASDVISQIERSVSLATGITVAHALRMRAGRPAEKKVQDQIDSAFQLGIYVPGRKFTEEGTMLLSFSMGRLSHALNVARAEVPGSGVWRQATRKDGQKPGDFIREVMKSGQPAIFRAMLQPDAVMTPDFIEMFVHGGRGAGATRTRFLGEELMAVEAHMPIEVEQVYVAQKSVKSSTLHLLEDLVEICGGPQAAAASWSAGIVAENILNSAFRKVKGSDEGYNPEAVWLSSRDRALMLPVITALCSSGADLVSAQCGQITVRIPTDPEMLIPLLHVAWECGLHLPLDEIVQLNAIGVPIPSDIESFGGNDVDYFLSAVAHQGKRNAMWSVDGIMDLPLAERKTKIREIFPDAG